MDFGDRLIPDDGGSDIDERLEDARAGRFQDARRAFAADQAGDAGIRFRLAFPENPA